MEFNTPILLSGINIFETYYGGSVKQIIAKGINKQWQVIWQDATFQSVPFARVFSPQVSVFNWEFVHRNLIDSP